MVNSKFLQSLGLLGKLGTQAANAQTPKHNVYRRQKLDSPNQNGQFGRCFIAQVNELNLAVQIEPVK